MHEPKKRKKYDTVDVVRILQELNVFYADSGKNVTAGWVNVNCPFCHDPSWHLGINLLTNRCSCWKCGKRTSFWYFLKEKFGFDNYRLGRLFNQHSQMPLFGPETHENRDERDFAQSELKWPSNVKDAPLPIHEKYLRKRGFNAKELTPYYNLKYTGHNAFYTKNDKTRIDFRYRILAPVVMHGKTVNFIGRDVTENENAIRYKNCPNEESLITTKDCLYNSDGVKDIALIVEGPTDVWNIGFGAVGVIGIKVTKRQIAYLQELRLKKAVLLFDEGAKEEEDKLADILSIFVPEVLSLEEIWDDYDDPGNLSKDQVKEIRKLVFRR